VRLKINREVVWRWRLRLAQLIAPPGADVHNPDDTCCPRDRDLLEAICFGWLRQGDRSTMWMDVTIALDEACAGGLVNRGKDGPPWLTSHGEQELARLWGPKLVPPGGGGYFECDDHGLYDLFPGDRWGCPGCETETALRRLNTEPVSWWARSVPWRVYR